jgi:hypothetical protein
MQVEERVLIVFEGMYIIVIRLNIDAMITAIAERPVAFHVTVVTSSGVTKVQLHGIVLAAS